MATQIFRKISYGLSEPLIDNGQGPIIAKRDPATNDKALVGTEWVNTDDNTAFFLTSVVDNIATWVPITNTGASPNFQTDSGIAIPAANIINLLGGVNVTTSGIGNTILVSIDGVVDVPNGGTGLASFTPYAVVTGGTTGTGDLQQVVGVGTSGQILTSNGAASLPSWQANAGAGGAVTFHTDGADATTAANAITIAGGTNITTSGAGSTVTINLDTTIADTYQTDSGSAVPAAGIINIEGDSASITTSGSGNTVVIHYTPFIRTVTTTPYVVVGIDYFLAVDATGGPITINMPNTTTTGRMFIVKDYLGQANINNINITTPGGVALFDGFTAYTLNAQYQSVNLIFDGTNYMIW